MDVRTDGRRVVGSPRVRAVLHSRLAHAMSAPRTPERTRVAGRRPYSPPAKTSKTGLLPLGSRSPVLAHRVANGYRPDQASLPRTLPPPKTAPPPQNVPDYSGVFDDPYALRIFDYDYSDRPASARGAHRRGVLVAAAVIVLGAAGGYIGLRSGGGTSRPPGTSAIKLNTSPTPDVTTSQVDTWISTNLAADTTVGTDPALPARLTTSGSHGIRVGAIHAASWRGNQFVISTPTLRATAAVDASVADALRSSVAIAVFGPAQARVEVRMIVAGAVNRPTAKASVASERTEAGSALLRNPGLDIASDARNTVAAGHLDIRASIVLALLAAQGQVGVDRITRDPAEAAARMPARTIEITTGHNDSVQTVLAGLSSTYRPSSSKNTVGSHWVLTWPVDIAPVQSVS